MLASTYIIFLRVNLLVINFHLNHHLGKLEVVKKRGRFFHGDSAALFARAKSEWFFTRKTSVYTLLNGQIFTDCFRRVKTRDNFGGRLISISAPKYPLADFRAVAELLSCVRAKGEERMGLYYVFFEQKELNDSGRRILVAARSRAHKSIKTRLLFPT